MAETFELSDDELAHADEWVEQHRKDEVIEYTGAIGGRFSFVFIPTSINVVKEVHCTICGASENLNDIPLALDPYARGCFSPGFRLNPGDAGRRRPVPTSQGSGYGASGVAAQRRWVHPSEHRRPQALQGAALRRVGGAPID